MTQSQINTIEMIHDTISRIASVIDHYDRMGRKVKASELVHNGQPLSSKMISLYSKVSDSKKSKDVATIFCSTNFARNMPRLTELLFTFGNGSINPQDYIRQGSIYLNEDAQAIDIVFEDAA